MSNPVDLLPRTPIAATSFVLDKNVHLRVYTQDIHGGIRESRYDGHGWNGGGPNDVIVRAKPYSPIAAISWLAGNHVQIRLYYLTPENQLFEHCWVGDKWVAGGLNNNKIQASPTSQLAALAGSKGFINVYFQKPDNVIQELRYTDKWFLDKTLNKALAGTYLSSVLFKNDQGIRVYYQRPDSKLAESAWDHGKGWYNGGFSFDAPAGASLAAISWSDNPEIRVYSVSQAGVLVEFGYSGKWSGPHGISNAVIPASGTAAVTWDSTPQIRVYRQAHNDQVLEEVWDGSGRWATGSLVPTGKLQ